MGFYSSPLVVELGMFPIHRHLIIHHHLVEVAYLTPTSSPTVLQSQSRPSRNWVSRAFAGRDHRSLTSGRFAI